jgi:diguanylate cyclase (GGDEF)-like protein
MGRLPTSENSSRRLLILHPFLVHDLFPRWESWETSLVKEGWSVRCQDYVCTAVNPNDFHRFDVVLLGVVDSLSPAIALWNDLQSLGEPTPVPVIIFEVMGGENGSSPEIQPADRASPNLDTPALHLTPALDPLAVFNLGAADYFPLTLSVEEAIARIRYHGSTGQRLISLTQTNQRLQTEIKTAQQAEAALRVQAAQEQMFAELTSNIRQSLDLSTILESTVHELRHLLQTDRVIIYRFNPDWSGEIAIESVQRPELSILGEVIYDPCFEHHWNRRYLLGHICVLDDILAQPLDPCYVAMLTGLKVRANLVLPILQQDQLWGLLIAHHCTAPRIWQSWEVGLLKKLASQLAIAIQQSELYLQLQAANRELQRLANLDSLTQLANRRQFDEYIAQEWRRLQREQQPLTLLLCDIDHFKAYNDFHGHQAGDECLRQVARAIANVVKRPADLVARYGGEEFSVILPNTDSEGALEVAQQIHNAIAQLSIEGEFTSRPTSVTISIGVASVVPPRQADFVWLIAIADKALYQAKAQGRNCYCLWDPELQ